MSLWENSAVSTEQKLDTVNTADDEAIATDIQAQEFPEMKTQPRFDGERPENQLRRPREYGLFPRSSPIRLLLFLFTCI